MSYIECPHCGHRALSVATRCPHCSHDLPPRPLHRPPPSVDLARLGPIVGMAGVVVAVIALAVFVWRRSGAGPAAAPPVAPPAEEVAPAATAPSEPPASMPADSFALTAPQPALPMRTIRRYAQTWVNVRGERRRTSIPIRVLNPGEAVQVDSLQVGWYRVVVDGRPGGYVHRSNLGTAPPPTLP